MSATAAPIWRPLTVLNGLIDLPEPLEVCDLTQDSGEVSAGAAFLACRGRTHHGLEFAHSAVAAGARAILWEPAPGVTPPALDGAILVRAVPNLHALLGAIADRFFDAPSANLRVTGITGTNGKTTCAWLLAQALALCGRRTAYIGTLGAGVPGEIQALRHTTPDALTLHRLLAQQRALGCDSVAMEVSSHALDQDRCAGVRFHTALFTNLTRDHLDYHGDMGTYGAAKARLLRWPGLAARVINVDDPYGCELAREWLPGGRDRDDARLFLTSQLPAGRPAAGADFVCASAIRSGSAAALELTLTTSRGAARLASRLIGDFNVENLLSVLAALLARDVPLADACAALARCAAPPGRMQLEGGGALPLVVIDYAHTPDALSKALRALRSHSHGRLWCVFGCGGERDRGKRGQMGEAAALAADELIVTDDNPRREDPGQIAASIMEGITAVGAAARARVIHERAEAIGRAIANAAVQDVVLVAGKGHEDYQLVGAERRPFSDTAVVRALLAQRSAA